MKRFHFRATYLTLGGYMGKADFIVEASDISEAMDLGIARVERRKKYFGKMDACVSAA